MSYLELAKQVVKNRLGIQVKSEETSPQPKYPGQFCIKCSKPAVRKTWGKDRSGKEGANYYCAECEIF